jgi:hypothetical protein
MAVVSAVAAVSLAVATTTFATVAAAVVAVSMAVGMVGLAVTAVGIVTGNKDLLKAGKIMGYVGLAGGLAGGIAGGIGSVMNLGADAGLSEIAQGFGGGFMDAFKHAANPEAFGNELAAKAASEGATQQALGQAVGDAAQLSGQAGGFNAASPDGSIVLEAMPNGGYQVVPPPASIDASTILYDRGADLNTEQYASKAYADTLAASGPANVGTQPVSQPSVASTGVNAPAVKEPNILNYKYSGQYDAPPVGQSNADVFNANANRLLNAGNITGTPAAEPGVFDFMKNVPDYIKYGGVTAVGQAGAGLLQGVMASSNLDDQNRLKAQEIAVAQQKQNRLDAQFANTMAPTSVVFANNQYRAGIPGILNS